MRGKKISLTLHPSLPNEFEDFEMSTMIRPALSLLVLMTLITGVAYPLVVTGVAQVAFPEQANGSLVHDADRQSPRLVADRPGFRR